MNRLTFRSDDSSLPYLVSEKDVVAEPETGAYYGGDAINRLAAYEDSGLEPGEVLPKKKTDEIALKLMRLADLESFCSYDRLRELAEADKEGRAAVLPCKPDGKMLDLTVPGLPGIMRNIHFEIVYESEHGITFHEPAEKFSKKLEKGRIVPCDEGLVVRKCDNCTGRFCTQEVLGSGGCCWEEKK